MSREATFGLLFTATGDLALRATVSIMLGGLGYSNIFRQSERARADLLATK